MWNTNTPLQDKHSGNTIREGQQVISYRPQPVEYVKQPSNRVAEW